MAVIDDYKNRLRASAADAHPQWSRAIENYKHYLAKLNPSYDKGDNNSSYAFASKMVLPISFEIVETIMPRIIGKEPEYSVAAFEDEDIPYEQTARLTIESQYKNPKLELLGEPIYLKIYRGLKETLITGNAVYRPFWRRETIRRAKYIASLEKAGIVGSDDIAAVMQTAKKMNIENEIRYQKKLVDSPFLDDFDLRHVPFFMYFGDWQMVEPGRFRYHIERDYITFEELADEAEIFSYDKSVMDEIAQLCRNPERASHTPEIGIDFFRKYNDIFKIAGGNNATTGDDKRTPLLIRDKMWCDGKVHVIVNEKYVLTNDGVPNPYDIGRPPFIFSHDIPIPHSYFSRSTIDWIKRLEDGATDLLNMRNDNLIQSMLNIWLYDPNLLNSGEDFVPVPNSLTAVRDVDRAVRPISGRDVTPNAYREIEDLYAFIQRATGVNDYTKGLEGETIAGRTYGGMRLIQEAANARFIVKSRLFETTTLKALGYYILEMARQFINNDRVVRITGLTGETLRETIKSNELKLLRGFVDIRVTPNSGAAVDQQAEAIKMNSMADRLSSNVGPFANMPDTVLDRFLYKYLLANGISDAMYWVRERKKAREQSASDAAPPSVPKGFNFNGVSAGSVPVMQSDQIANQPDPLAQIMSAEAQQG